MKNALKTLAAAAAIFVLAAVPASAKAKETSKTAAAKAAPVDINSASQAQLEALPGVGASTAKKIVSGRPYSSVADLSRAGVSARTIEKITPLVTVGASAAAAPAEKPKKESRASAPAEKPARGEKTATASTGPVDINAASQKDLEALPGVGAATAKKIVAGRPYASVADLSKAGVSTRTIEKITPLVTVGGAAAAAPAEKPAKGTRSSAPASSSPSAAAGPVDLNSASQKDLEALPAVGAATAKKIIAGRPYSSVADLSRAGVSAKTIETITPLVTVGKTSAPAPSPAAPMEKPARVKPAPATGKAPSASPAGVEARTPPAPGMVWVNTATKIFHREGDPWYGKTKEGKFMTEADAIQAGYRVSKQGEPKKQ